MTMSTRGDSAGRRPVSLSIVSGGRSGEGARRRWRATTEGISVTVEPKLNAYMTAADEGIFHWDYLVTVDNGRREDIQILSREWLVTDLDGLSYRTSGVGVISQQPTLGPGNSFQYESNTCLPTAGGAMVGSLSVRVGQRLIKVAIPKFRLPTPDP